MDYIQTWSVSPPFVLLHPSLPRSCLSLLWSCGWSDIRQHVAGGSRLPPPGPSPGQNKTDFAPECGGVDPCLQLNTPRQDTLKAELTTTPMGAAHFTPSLLFSNPS